MEHPYGRCGHCGERVYAHVNGGYRCSNCDARYPVADDGGTVRQVRRR